MPITKILTNRNLVPEKVQLELDFQDQGLWHFKNIESGNVTNLSTVKEQEKTIQESTSSQVFFSEIVKNGWAVGAITGGAQRTFINFGVVSSTIALSSLYEHVRGYLYRDFSIYASDKWNQYLTTSAGISGFIVSKRTTASPPALPSTTIGSLSSARIVLFNRSVYKDRIKPGSVKIYVRRVGVQGLDSDGLDFPNDRITDAYAAGGAWASITGGVGLSGSLSSGTNGSVLTGFTILMSARFENTGPIEQTIFHRRVAHPSLSSLDYSRSGASYSSGYNNKIVKEKYRDLNPLKPNVLDSKGARSGAFEFGMTLGGDLDYTFTASTSAVIRVTNQGGGQWFYNTSANKGAVRIQWPNSSIFNPNFIVPVNSNNGLSGWTTHAGVQLMSEAEQTMQHSISAGKNVGSAVHNATLTSHFGNNFLVMVVSGNVASATHAYQQLTDIANIRYGTRALAISFSAAVAGSESGDPDGEFNFILGDATTASLSTWTWTRTPFVNAGGLSAISLTAILPADKIIRPDYNKSLYIGFFTDAQSQNKYYGIKGITVRALSAGCVFGISNTASSTATLTAWIDSSISSTPADASGQGGQVKYWYPKLYFYNNHPWQKADLTNNTTIYTWYIDQIGA